MQIHQLVPALHDGDAIGDSARAMRDFLRSKGYDSRLFAYNIDESLSGEASNFDLHPPVMSGEDILILHFAVPSGMTEFVKRAACKKAIIYHNITPAYFWLPYDRSLVHLAYAGRKELESLAPFVDRAAGDSEYNRRELDQLAFRNTCVLPIYVRRERYEVPPSRIILKKMRDDYFQFLFVGRIAPNKKLEDVLKLVYYYRKLYDPLSRVVFVGKTDVVPAYREALREFTSRLEFMPEDVVFAGHVDWPELVAYYKSSHLFISMSAHEGFCVPLVEAMICETPIVAYSKTAVPDTLGDAGIQFDEKDFVSIAGMCHRIRTDDSFRNSILERQRKQLEKYSMYELEKSIQEFLLPLVAKQ